MKCNCITVQFYVKYFILLKSKKLWLFNRHPNAKSKREAVKNLCRWAMRRPPGTDCIAGGKPPGMQAAPVNLKPAAKGMSPNSSIHETGRTIIIYSTIFKWKIAGRNLDLKTEFVHTRHFLVTTEDLPFTFEKKQWNFEGLWSPWDSIFIALIRDQNKN